MKHSFSIIFLAAFLATSFCASSAFAQTATSTDTQSLSATLDDIQKQIQKLGR